jgi:hypothetical protein
MAWLYGDCGDVGVTMAAPTEDVELSRPKPAACIQQL